MGMVDMFELYLVVDFYFSDVVNIFDRVNVMFFMLGCMVGLGLMYVMVRLVMLEVIFMG